MFHYLRWIPLLAFTVAGGWLLFTGWGTPPAAASKASLEPLLKKATVDGKYGMLLAQVKAEKDKEKYGEFRDLGLKDPAASGDGPDLPKGYWVYASPYLYVWRDKTSVQRPKRQWGPEQATGEPDTNMAGDIVTAWASQTPDGQDEWLMLEYAEPVVPTAVLVYETYNPGALVRVTAFRLSGQEVELWKGQDPTTPDSAMGTSEIPVKADFKTNRVKLYFDSKNVPGWNEIDAVGLRDKGKTMHWAVAAEASSTYAPPYDAMPAFVGALPDYENRIRTLEQEINAQKESIAELKRTVEELKRKMDKDK